LELYQWQWQWQQHRFCSSYGIGNNVPWCRQQSGDRKAIANHFESNNQSEVLMVMSIAFEWGSVVTAYDISSKIVKYEATINQQQRNQQQQQWQWQ